jgi:hypothetical protein
VLAQAVRRLSFICVLPDSNLSQGNGNVVCFSWFSIVSLFECCNVSNKQATSHSFTIFCLCNILTSFDAK